MHPYPQSLDANGTWHMHRHKHNLQVIWPTACGPRPLDGPPPHAHDLEFKDCGAQQGCYQWFVGLRFDVSCSTCALIRLQTNTPTHRATLTSLMKLDCVTGWPKIDPMNVTKWLFYPLLMQTIELPLGLICCCIPCLKPAWKEIRFLSSSAASRLMSFTGASDTGRSTSTFKSDLQTNESTKNFVSLQDEASDNGSAHLGNQAAAHGNDIELGTSKGSESAQNIHVVHSYSIRR